MPAALLTGWFSFVDGEATAGDLLARDAVHAWLVEAGYQVDVAMSPAFREGVDWRQADPAAYDDVVFVCGPFSGRQVRELLARFAACRRVGVNLSIIDPADADLFDVLLERDGAGHARPDVSLAPVVPTVPVVGVVRAHPQPEYRDGRHREVESAIRRLVASRPCATVAFDTRVDPRTDPFGSDARTTAEVESLIARMDLVITSRLHGLVLALKHGVPAVAIDPIVAGAKVLAQARALRWPLVLTADRLDQTALQQMFDACLTAEARRDAGRVAARARAQVDELGAELFEALRRTDPTVGGRSPTDGHRPDRGIR